jgi:RNA polymerase sigma factor (sigma-70 family)
MTNTAKQAWQASVRQATYYEIVIESAASAHVPRRVGKPAAQQVMGEKTLQEIPSSSPEYDLYTIKLVKQGNRDMFRELVLKYQEEIYSLVLRLVGDAALAQQLVVEIFVRAYRHLLRFPRREAFADWLLKLALDHMNHFYSSKRFRRWAAAGPPCDLKIVQCRDLEERERRIQLVNCFQRGLADLPADLRDVLVVAGLAGRDWADTAALLNIRVACARRRLNRARLSVKKKFRRLTKAGAHQSSGGV